MTPLRVWLSRVAGLFGRSSRDRALDDEIRAHIDDLADDLVERGMSRADAAAEARRQFGGVDQVKASYRDQRGWPFIDSVGHDAMLAFRQLRTQRASALLVVLCLGLGMGVSMAFFTIVNAHCLRGLPIPRADRVLFLSTRDRSDAEAGLSFADVDALQHETTTFSGVAAYTSTAFSVADDLTAPERIAGSYISAGGFSVLGGRPLIGREFNADDTSPAAAAVVVIGHDVWTSRYGSDPSIIGRRVRIDGRPSTVVGVMPSGFRFPGHANAWLPLRSAPGSASDASTRNLSGFGRLIDGVTSADADAVLARVTQQLTEKSEPARGDVRIAAVPINERFTGRITEPTWLAFLTSGLLVLLVACANVANLLIARVAVRTREVALRLAMGATRARIVRQLLVESLVLAFVSGAAGLGLAFTAVRLLAWSVPTSAPLPYWITYAVDSRVLLALLVTCVASVVIFGMVPALHGTKVDTNSLLKDGGRHGTATRRARRLSGAFMVAQLALALVLLVAMSIDVRSTFGPAGPGLEVDPAPLLTAQIALPPTRYGSPEDRRRFFDELDERVRRASGVTSTTLVAQLPPAGGMPMLLRLPAQAPGAGEEGERVFAATIGSGYFDTLDVPLVAGRDLAISDSLAGSEGAVVSQHFASRTFPDRPAVGERIGLVDARGANSEPIWRTIVGIAPDLQHGPSPRALVYVPYDAPPSSVVLVVRASGSLELAGMRIREAAAAIDRDLPVHRVVPLITARHESNWAGRVSSVMLRSISSVALLLTVIGLYSVTAYGIAQRTQEIGVRVALGATARQVALLVLRRALAYVALGLAVGLPLTYVYGRTFGDTASGASLTSPLNLLPVIVLIVVAVVACAWPAVRASRMPPATTLRSD